MTIVRERWEEFRQGVMAEDAGPIQVFNMQAAFYGGAYTMFQLVIAKVRDAPDEAAARDAMKALHDELQEYAHDVERATRGSEDGVE